MNSVRKTALCLIVLACHIFVSPVSSLVGQHTGKGPDDIWVSAYLASWNHYAPPGGNWGNLPTEAIDWDAFTHLFYFSFQVYADGTLTEPEPYHNINSDRLSSIVQAAHDAGKPVLFTIGGWGNHAEFSTAIRPENRTILIESIIHTMTSWGFDGVDLDLEPIYDSDVEHYRNFIVELHEALQTVSTPLRATPLLTVATNGQPKLFAAVHEKLDQINLMTYDFSGAWNGWVSWHNAAVYSSHNFPDLAKPLPSVDNMVQAYLDAGVPPSKLGIGIDFYGYVWSGGHGMPSGGATAPNQSWSTPPAVTDNVPYHKIMDEYRPASTYSWDSEAQAAYLSIDQPGSSDDKFISYDDERSIQAKFDYVADHGLGGLIIWELTGGYRANQPAGQRDLLLQAVKDALQEYRRANATPARLVKDK